MESYLLLKAHACMHVHNGRMLVHHLMDLRVQDCPLWRLATACQPLQLQCGLSEWQHSTYSTGKTGMPPSMWPMNHY